jgi:hypothetical protein
LVVRLVPKIDWKVDMVAVGVGVVVLSDRLAELGFAEDSGVLLAEDTSCCWATWGYTGEDFSGYTHTELFDAIDADVGAVPTTAGTTKLPL